MDHQDHVGLLRGGIPEPGGVWADLGAGAGAFTLALAELVGPQAEIYAVDRDGGVLGEAGRAVRGHFPGHSLHLVQADFTRGLDLPLLDGVVMANSLHFERHKEPVLRRILGYLKPQGRLILVEYNVNRGNLWVPYPLSYSSWEALAARCGFRQTRLLSTHPSRFLHEIYSAFSQL